MANKESKSTKAARIFEELADVKERLTRVECHEETEQKKLNEVSEKLDKVTCQLHEIIGKDSVRAAIYGVVGSVIAAVVAWLITLVKGA